MFAWETWCEKLSQNKGGWRSAIGWETDHRNLEGKLPGAVNWVAKLVHLLLQ